MFINVYIIISIIVINVLNVRIFHPSLQCASRSQDLSGSGRVQAGSVLQRRREQVHLRREGYSIWIWKKILSRTNVGREKFLHLFFVSHSTISI